MLTRRQQTLIDLAMKGGTDKELILLDLVHSLEDRLVELEAKVGVSVEEVKASIPNLDKVLESVRGTPGEPGAPGQDAVPPTEEELISLILPLIPVPKDGKTPSKDELLVLIKPLIPVVQDGKTPSKEEILAAIESLMPEFPDWEQVATSIEEKLSLNLPKFGTQFRDALELLQGDERLDASAIKNLPEAVKQYGSVGIHGSLWSLADVSVAGITSNQSIKWDGTQWVAYTPTSGSGITVLSATETPNGVRTVFTFSGATSQPSYLRVDNVWMKATSASGAVNWTWAAGPKQATLTIPPTDDIEAIV